MLPFFEWYLGYPPANPGEGTTWSVDIIRPWPAQWPAWAGGLLWLGSGLLVAAVAWRLSRQLTWPRRVATVTVRLAALTVLAVLLAETTLAVRRTGLPTVVVLLDSSRSMSLPDAASPRSPQHESGDAPLPESRLQAARKVLIEPGGLLAELLHRRRLKLLTFDDQPHQLGPAEIRSPHDLQEVADELQRLEATGAASHPARCLLQVLEETRGTPPLAIVILTDGVSTPPGAGPLATVIDPAREQGVPVFVVETGPPEAAPDIELSEVLLDDVAIAGSPLRIPGQIHVTGFAGETLTIRMHNAATNELLTSTRIKLPPQSGTLPFTLEYTPPAPGEFDFAFHVMPLDGEAQQQNNTVQRHVSVREGRLRILLADRVPRYEFRYLKSFLEKYASQSGTIELETILQEGDLDYARQDRSAARLLGQFPITPEALDSYDVMILGDLDPSLIPSTVQEHLRDFVIERGRAVILIAGQRFNPVNWRQTPLIDLVPARVERSPPADTAAFEQAHTLRFTPAAIQSLPLLQSLSDSADAADSLEQWPALTWFQPGGDLKPATVVLAETSGETVAPHPIITLLTIGRGKVLYHGTDEFWRWRHAAAGAFYGPYWIQQIRFLCRARMLGRDTTAELTSDRMIYQSGDPVRLRVRFFEAERPAAQSEAVIVQLEQRGSGTRRVELTKNLQNPGVFDVRLGELTEGSYHGWIASPDFEGRPPSCDFRIEVSDQELLARQANHEQLQELADATGGKLYSSASASEMPYDLPDGVPLHLEPLPARSLWDRWETLMLLTSLLALDWYLRQRWQAGA